MRKNQTARSETGFNGYPKEATAMDIMLFIDYVALRRPSSSSGHGTVFFTRQQDQQYKRYLFTPEVTDCLRLTLKMVTVTSPAIPKTLIYLRGLTTNTMGYVVPPFYVELFLVTTIWRVLSLALC